MAQGDPRELLARVGSDVRAAYARNKRVMSFEEFFALLVENPARHGRSAAQYLKDVFDHYGAEDVKSPRGTLRRFRLFDAPFDDGRDRLVGQEEVQGRVYRVLSNFVREGRVNKLILLHGPNGSAKSTFVSCLVRALEHYSGLDEGPVYRINWIFPSQQLGKSGIGFGGAGADGETSAHGFGSYAYLDDDQLDARLPDELHDHPALLLPKAVRAELFRTTRLAHGFVPSSYLVHGDLGHKNRQIFEALLAAHRGDYLKVLRHVQVERLYLSRRYRAGVVTVEPQLAVDAHSRQLTMDRSLQALPPALQALSLHEYSGELVNANRGIIEYSDLLKRPLEHWKYLLGTVEQSRVPIDDSILFLDLVFIGSSNEAHLSVFKEVPEFQSFKGRIELVRVPYLLDYTVEEKIYRDSVRPASTTAGADALPVPSGVEKHVAPHTVAAAALWAVLTRMRKPLPEKYPKALSELVAKLQPLEKADLYAIGRVPDGLSTEQARELSAAIDRIWSESDSYPNYEGRTGASPREVKTLILNAAQSEKYPCLSPLAVLDEMEDLVKNVSVYEFLKQEPLPGGYHENRKFIQVVRDRYVEWVDDEVRSSIGLVEESRYAELFSRYVQNVSHWVKKEKLRNPITGRMEEPDEDLMTEVERTIGGVSHGRGTTDEVRRDVIARIGGWSIDHPNQRPDYAQVFPRQIQQLREAYFEQQKKLVKKTAQDLLVFLTDEAERTDRGSTAAGASGNIDKESRDRVELTLRNLRERFGYCERCAREAVSFLVRRRYS